MTTVTGWDATRSNLPHAPRTGQAAGYTTGTPDIAWAASDWAAHPGAVRIDQDAAAGDGTADALDVESGAATAAECPGWVRRARASFAAATRKGQREPVIYVNGSNITLVANALKAAGITGVGLWLADPGVSLAEAEAKITGASGPYPIVGVQYAWTAQYDLDVWDKTWLDTVSGAVKPGTPYRHVVPEGNSKSFWRIAKDRGVDERWLLGFQKGTPINAQHLAVLTAMVAADDACAAAGLPRPALTAGVVYYTEHA